MATVTDEEAGRQILSIFVRYRVPASGALRRINFFDIRDGDFQRGINRAVQHNWITLHQRDRYRYILTDVGYAAGRVVSSRRAFVNARDGVAPALRAIWVTEQIEAPDGDCQ